MVCSWPGPLANRQFVPTLRSARGQSTRCTGCPDQRNCRFEFLDGDLAVCLFVIPLGCGVPVLHDIPGVGRVFDLALVGVFDNPVQGVGISISPDGLLLLGIGVLSGTFGQVLGIGHVCDGEVVDVWVFKRISDLVGLASSVTVLTLNGFGWRADNCVVIPVSLSLSNSL